MAFRDPNIQAPARLNPATTPTFINPGSALCLPIVQPPSPGITITPGSATLAPNATQQFTANAPVTWTASAGTISSTGLFTAPNVTVATIVTITATSTINPQLTGTVLVSIQPATPQITVAISPSSVTLNPGGTQQFTAVVTGSTNQNVVWSLIPGVGTITTAGLYTAPATVASTTTVTVGAVAVVDTNAASHATVTLNPSPAAIAVSISPTAVSLTSGQTQQFTATVTGTSNHTVTWHASAGTISSAGLFTAPTVTTATSVTITATSAADATKSAQVTFTVQPATAISVTVSPTSVTLQSGNAQQFTATVTGTTNHNVTWTASAGSITTAGLFTAPTVSAQTTATITATSAADTTKHASVTVTIQPAGTGQLDLLQWWTLTSRATQHLVGDPSAPYAVQYLSTDAGYPAGYPPNTIWHIKNKLGNPWDVMRWDQNFIYHWITENGDAVDKPACQAANGTSCWLYAKAYKRKLVFLQLMPRFFTPGTTITYNTPAPNYGHRTTDCEATFTQTNLGPVRTVTTGPFKISWGGSIDKGSGTLATGPNYDSVNGVNTIKNQYMFTQNSSQPTGYADIEETYYVLGFGRVAWYNYHNGVFVQKTVNTTLASGGAPKPNFPCGPGKSWFV